MKTSWTSSLGVSVIVALPDGETEPSLAYCRPWLRVWALPVLPVSWSFAHWMELSPSWVVEEL